MVSVVKDCIPIVITLRVGAALIVYCLIKRSVRTTVQFVRDTINICVFHFFLDLHRAAVSTNLFILWRRRTLIVTIRNAVSIRIYLGGRTSQLIHRFPGGGFRTLIISITHPVVILIAELSRQIFKYLLEVFEIYRVARDWASLGVDRLTRRGVRTLIGSIANAVTIVINKLKKCRHAIGECTKARSISC